MDARRAVLASTCLALVLLYAVAASALFVQSTIDKKSGTAVLEARISVALPPQACDDYEKLYTMWASNPGFRDALTEDIRQQMFEKIAEVVLGEELEEAIEEYNVNTSELPNVTSLKIDYSVEQLPSGGCTVYVKVYATIVRVSQGENAILAKYRLVRLDEPISIAGLTVIPSRAFFLDFTPFGEPLGEWERLYNGTHTVFRLHLDSVEMVASDGSRVAVDPEMVIIVPGYAVGMGDLILFEQPITTTTVTKTVTTTQQTTETRTMTVTVTETASETRTSVAQFAGLQLDIQTISVIVLAIAVAIAVVVATRAWRSTIASIEGERKKYVRRR